MGLDKYILINTFDEMFRVDRRVETTREHLIISVEKGIAAARLDELKKPLADKLREKAKTITRTVSGSWRIGDCGCPLTQCGVVAFQADGEKYTDDVILTRSSLDKFAEAFDRYMQNEKETTYNVFEHIILD